MKKLIMIVLGCSSALFAQDAFKSVVENAAGKPPAAAPAPAQAQPAPASPAAASGENVVATVGEEKDPGVRTVALPAARSAEQVLAALELGIDIKESEMKFNDALLLLSRIEGVNFIIAPELSTPEKVAQKLSFVPGRIALREFLAQIGRQAAVAWALDENGAIVLSAAKTIVITEGADPAKVKIDVDFAGTPLGNVMAHIAQQTGVIITVAEDVRNQPVEIIVNGWDAERLIRYIADMYGLRYEKTAENAFNVLK